MLVNWYAFSALQLDASQGHNSHDTQDCLRNASSGPVKPITPLKPAYCISSLINFGIMGMHSKEQPGDKQRDACLLSVQNLPRVFVSET